MQHVPPGEPADGNYRAVIAATMQGLFPEVTGRRELRALDPTRTIDHASGWHDQGAGDLWSRHLYARRFRAPRRRRRDRRALVLSEYGGYDLHVHGHTSGDHDFGYRHFESAEALGAAFTRLHADLAAEVPRGLAATVYTQVSDVEDEVNGLVTFDREVLKLPEETVRAALAPLREAGKLGYVLFQFAPWVRFDAAWLQYVASLPERLPGMRPAAYRRSS